MIDFTISTAPGVTFDPGGGGSATFSPGDYYVQDDKREIYDGCCDVTPTSEGQTLLTAGYVLLNDIIIEPIPSNYGLVSWNGVALTIS